MATGFIGTSSVQGSGTGPTLSYTCPLSGVRYAVVSVIASAAASGVSGAATAGPVRAEGTSSANSSSYSVILAPGQTWAAGTFSANQAGASLSASVLEIA